MSSRCPRRGGVVRDGSIDGLIVLDPDPTTPVDKTLLVRANVVLRHFPFTGPVGAAALREAVAVREGVCPEFG